METPENVKLGIPVDKSVVGLFINGRQCARAYPGRDDRPGGSILSQWNNAESVNLDARRMKNI
ncbi:MAG: hypothetical protein MI975_03725 [Cytophagales bacterium]|nr:hypothetical protein [Cytophagales bacterium]